ncbi:MAG: transcription termination factor Rho [Clostridia bacterium]|nr:transcription termination factor Rho [Clostridia bacterium]
MTEQNLNEMTVIELRKLAKELQVPLRAGISKAGIVERLTEEITGQKPAGEAASAAEEDKPAAKTAPAAVAEDKPAAEDKNAAAEKIAPAPGFRQAAPAAAPRFSSKPAYQAPAFGNRGPAARPTEPQRTQTTRPVGFTPRFGPAAAQEHPAPAPAPREEAAIRTEAPRPAYQPENRTTYQPEARPSFQPESRPAYQAERRPSYNEANANRYPTRPAPEARPGYEARPAHDTRPAPSAAEMMTPAECPEGSGVLEMHPDGYGFLRTDSLLPTARDIFVAASQVRRFGLRAGDRIVGRVRPMRDGDKYAALLYLTSINGAAPDTLVSRPSFDELTAIYPKRRIRLTSPDGATPDALRLMDLMTPIGFGQRGLIICPNGTRKRGLMAHLANAIHRNHPGVHVATLLFNDTPEDVTELRDHVDTPVLATTFDMPPEHHLRLADLAVENAARMAEMKQDVVLLVDSLTTLARVFTTAAMQQGRQLPGSINPASLQKAKRLFGAARCLREGGSLTVIAVMNNDPASKLDEAIINEFRTAANMELLLDADLHRKGVRPAIDLTFSGTKRAEGIQTPEEKDALHLVRSILREVAPEKAIPELLRMLDNAGSGEELLSRIRSWVDAVK